MPKLNPMLKALDQELAGLHRQRDSLDERISTVLSLRETLGKLVRKKGARPKAPQEVAA